MRGSVLVSRAWIICWAVRAWERMELLLGLDQLWCVGGCDGGDGKGDWVDKLNTGLVRGGF